MEKINKKTSIILILLSLPIIAILAFIFYLEMASFDIDNPEGFETNLIERYSNEIEFTDEGMKLYMSSSDKDFLISNMFLNHMEKLPKIMGLRTNGDRIEVNLRHRGIRLPLSFAHDFYYRDGKLILAISDMKLGKSDKALSPNVSNIIKNFIGLKSDLLTSNKCCKGYLFTDFLPEAYKLVDVQYLVADKLMLNFDYDDKDYDKLLSYLDTDVPLAADYKAKKENLLSKSISIKNNNLTYEKSAFLEMIIKKPELIYDFLSLQSEYKDDFVIGINNLRNIFEIDESILSKNKEKLIAVYVDVFVKNIFEAFSKHFTENKFLSSQGRPYDLTEYKLYDIKTILEKEGHEYKSSVYDKMRFVSEDARFSVLYEISNSEDDGAYDDKIYYVRSANSREFLSFKECKDRYKLSGKDDFIIEGPKKVDEKSRLELKEYFKSHFGLNDIFVRYLFHCKDDFLIIFSDPKDYQNYKIVAFTKSDGKISILSEDIKDIEKFLYENSDFSAQLFPTTLIEASPVKVSEDTLLAIMDEMNIRGLASGSAEQIRYASYDGERYIYFSLKDGRDFVFMVEQTVFGTYLATVYEREKALNNWKDINQLITLE